MANGTVDNRLLGSTLGKVLQAVNVLDLVGRGGASQVQCFAARLTTQRGVGTLQPFVLSSSLVTVEGGGTVNLGEETLDLRLRPQGKVAGAPIVVPVRVTGSLSAPSVGPDPTAAVTANIGTAAGVAGTVLSTATPLGLVAGALGGQKLLGGSEGVDCSAALAEARGQAAPAATPATSSAPAPTAAPREKPKLPNPGQLLQKLFR
jgi:hypothetical protein